MNFKKIITGGIILANLAMPVCAKMYEKGMKTAMEMQYKVDLVGNFSGKEIKKISSVMQNIKEKIDRKKNGIEQITIENIDSHDERLHEDIYASATIEPKTNTILMSNKAIKGKAFGKNPLADYEGLLGHEIGHLIYDKCDQKQIFSDFWDLNVKYRAFSKKSEIPEGYVSAYPSIRPFMTRTNEDFADTFSYWANGRNYADNDETVLKKIEKIKGYLKNDN
jgi:hypothetical protein